MKVVLINDKVFDNVEVVRQTAQVILIIPAELKDGTDEEIEAASIMIPWSSLLYAV